MTLILADLTKLSRYREGMKIEEYLKAVDQDLQRLFIALRPSLVATLDETDIEVDMSITVHFRITLTANRTIPNPTNPRDGQDLIIEITQGGAGSFTITWGTQYRFSDDTPQPDLSTTAGKIDMIQFHWDSVNSIFKCLGYSRGYVA